MIKFFRDSYTNLTNSTKTGGAKIAAGATSNISFVTGRGSIFVGDVEYGKTQISASTLGHDAISASTPSVDSMSPGTFVVSQLDQSIQYWTGSAWQDFGKQVLSAGSFITANDANYVGGFDATSGWTDNYIATTKDVASAVTRLESKLSAAYSTDATDSSKITYSTLNAAANNIVVATSTGISRTEFEIDKGQVNELLLSAAPLTAKQAAYPKLSTTLVNANTLAEVQDSILKNSTSISGHEAVKVMKGEPTAEGGTLFTVSAAINADSGSGILTQDANGLKTNIKIMKKSTPETGYRASYALYSTASGSDVQLGDTINIVKDQFLKSAAYVAAYEQKSGGTTTGYIDWPAGDAIPTGIPAGTDRNSLPRFLKLTFAITKDGESGKDFPADSSDYTASDDDTVVYINVNELFDAYTGTAGVAVNADLNVISGVVDNGTGKNEDVYLGTGKYLNVNADGFYLTGITQSITSAINQLDYAYDGNSTDKTNTAQAINVVYKVTQTDGLVEVSGRNLSGSDVAVAQYVKSALARVNEGLSTLTTTTGYVSDALNTIVDTVYNYLDALDFAVVGRVWNVADKTIIADANSYTDKWYQVINQVDQINGQISANVVDLVAQNVAFAGYTADGVVAKGYTVFNGLSSITKYIADLDLATVGATGTAQGTANAYKIINTVSQTDGQVAATTLDLTDTVVATDGITAVLPTSTNKMTPSTARAAIAGGDVHDSLDSISNTLADYLSFHDAAGDIQN